MDTFRSAPTSGEQQLTLWPAPVDSPLPSVPAGESGRAVGPHLGLLILGCLICCALLATGVIAVGGVFKTLGEEEGRVERVLDEFMLAVENKDTSHAYTLVSTRATKAWTMSAIQDLTKGYNYVLFEGYRSLQVQDGTIGFESSSDPDQPQGIVARVSGIVIYDRGYTGSFEAVLEKEGDNWRILGIQITVPPDKLMPNPQNGFAAVLIDRRGNGAYTGFRIIPHSFRRRVQVAVAELI